MSVPLAQQAQAMLGHSDVGIVTERVDEVARRIGQRVPLGFVAGLDRPLPRHGQPRRGSWGWTAGRWWASLLTAGDPRNVSVAAAITGMHHTLSPLRGQRLEPLACRDDRLGPLLHPVSPSTSWHALAQDVHARRLAV